MTEQNLTFRKKKDVLPLAFSVFVMALGIYFMLSGRQGSGLLAMLLISFGLLAVHHLVSTSYTITQGGVLEVHRGLVFGTRKVMLGRVTTVRRYRAFFGLVRCLLIEHDAHRYISVQPDDVDAFIAALRRFCPRMKLITNDEA